MTPVGDENALEMLVLVDFFGRSRYNVSVI